MMADVLTLRMMMMTMMMLMTMMTTLIMIMVVTMMMMMMMMMIMMMMTMTMMLVTSVVRSRPLCLADNRQFRIFSHRLLYRCMTVDVSTTQATPWRQPVDVGYFTTPEDGDPTLRLDQSRCPPGSYCVSGVRRLCDSGYYGDVDGETVRTCSGPCTPGYYCDAGSNSSTQYECGNVTVYCPQGTAIPRVAQPGELTIGLSTSRRNATVTCSVSQYCVDGVALPCPAGRFGCATGLGTADCNGPCAAGSYCPLASSSNKEFSCGNASVYCPEGSALPVAVDVGYYSYGGLVAYQASSQAPCPIGSYCLDGDKVSAGGLDKMNTVCSCCCV